MTVTSREFDGGVDYILSDVETMAGLDAVYSKMLEAGHTAVKGSLYYDGGRRSAEIGFPGPVPIEQITLAEQVGATVVPTVLPRPTTNFSHRYLT